MRLVPDHDRDGRSALQAMRLDVPAGPLQHRMARDRQTRRVRHLAAGHEAHAGLPRQSEQLEQPGAHHLLGDRPGRRQDVQPRVLIPRARQPVRTDRGRERTAYDEAEVAGSGGRDDPRIGVAHEPLEDLGRVLSALGKRPSERPTHGLAVDGNTDRAIGCRLEKCTCELGGADQGIGGHSEALSKSQARGARCRWHGS